MTMLLTLLILGGFAQEADRLRCDDDCRAVLAAALRWTLEEVATEEFVDPERLFVDVSVVREGEDRDAERRVVAEIARALSLPVEDRSRHPAFVACIQDRLSDACRSASGVTAVTAYGVRLTGPDRATAYSAFRVVIADETMEWGQFRRTELFLENRDGAWQVVGTGVIVAS